jgi:hypothetical protein
MPFANEWAPGQVRHTAAKDRTFMTVRPNQGTMTGRV